MNFGRSFVGFSIPWAANIPHIMVGFSGRRDQKGVLEFLNVPRDDMTQNQLL
jgi:hypothetical protein